MPDSKKECIIELDAGPKDGGQSVRTPHIFVASWFTSWFTSLFTSWFRGPLAVTAAVILLSSCSACRLYFYVLKSLFLAGGTGDLVCSWRSGNSFHAYRCTAASPGWLGWSFLRLRECFTNLEYEDNLLAGVQTSLSLLRLRTDAGCVKENLRSLLWRLFTGECTQENFDFLDLKWPGSSSLWPVERALLRSPQTGFITQLF